MRSTGCSSEVERDRPLGMLLCVDVDRYTPVEEDL